MIKLENFEVMGWEHVIRGMRNPMNSWDKSDSCRCRDNKNIFNCRADDCPLYDTACNGEDSFLIGPNDHDLMTRLAKAGTDHRKFMRMITVYVDITAPLYWWKEFDTYKVGTVANSCSTMHKIHEKEFTLGDFSCEHLVSGWAGKDKNGVDIILPGPSECLENTIIMLNRIRNSYLIALKTESETGLPAKDIWWQMIQLLPSSYNQKRTVMLNYEVLANIYKSRKNHKLDEWRELCKWIESLPYSELITGGSSTKDTVEVVRCKNCMYYISAEDMKNEPMYKSYKNILGADGLCMSSDKYTDEKDFCSCGRKEE